MPQSRTTLALLASLALVLGSAAGAGAAPKPKPPPEPEPVIGRLVALGDSFSAGTGTFARVNDCYQSTWAYPVLIAQRIGAALDFRACEGATTADVAVRQLAAPMPDDTTRVTMTVGGNDVGFADVLSTCALPWNTNSCLNAINAGRNKLPALSTDLSALYTTIKTKAPPAATVTVAGYPRVFNGIDDCNILTFFDSREMSELNLATDHLDEVIATATATATVQYLDPRAAFDNHAVCDSSPYINGYSSPIGESYHPNRAGNVAYADLFAPAGGDSGGGGGKGGGKPRAAQTMSIDEQADYVADLGLDSPQSLARAEAAGLDPREIRGLVAQLRSGNEKVQLAALKRIGVLDEKASASAGR